ncbi:neuronal PAS domain-containing protein 4-like [Cebidichthys violaceus]|uniref:neuronal PAS domain-containing protein 4-like n=1 Tax=Cebidichthys violaceus TaxID=271503 RepID=UPI0035CB1B44
MTIWCNSCKCHVSAPCASHLVPEDHRSSFCRRFRSTKGASKARRDHINLEIRNMLALLPITQEDQERLSYLHSMAAICAYIRKSVLFQGLPAGARSHCSLPYEAFLQALHGFVLVTTAQGRLVYVSENVDEYLGLSMIDVLQGDTFYDLVERSDIDVVKSNLDIEHNLPSERSFICCMQTSKAFKLQHGSCCSMTVRGSFRSFPQPWPSSSVRPTSQPLFVALCTPTVDRLRSSDSHSCDRFDSVHRLDMTFTQLSDSVVYFLGYSAEEMAGRSWYSLVHPEDLSLSADSHRSLMRADEGFQVEMVLRLQCKDLSWTWIYIRANKESECQGVSCTNFIISETEARFLQKKISSEAFGPSPLANFAAQQAPHTETYSNTKCFKRQRTSSSQSEEPGAKARRETERDTCYVACASSRGDSSPAPSGDSPALFTPPYSPASSSSTLQQEELSHDLLMDVHGYTDQLLSSPECSPSYYSYPEAGLTCHQSPSGFLASAAEQTFDRAAFGALAARSPSSSSSSPTYDFQACAADARLVPDCRSVSDMCESPADCALHHDDFSLPEQPQGGGLVQVHHVPYHVLPAHSSLLTPSQSPTSTEMPHYSEREQAEISILAQQISSLASSFAMYHSHNPLQNVARPATTNTPPSACDWPHHPPLPSALPLKRELVLDDVVFDSILKDLDMGVRKGSTSCPGVAAYGYQQGSLRCRSGSHQSEPESLDLSPTITEDPLPAEHFTAMDPFSLQLGRHDRNTGLHQLNHYMQSRLQQDELAEENLY